MFSGITKEQQTYVDLIRKAATLDEKVALVSEIDWRTSQERATQSADTHGSCMTRLHKQIEVGRKLDIYCKPLS